MWFESNFPHIGFALLFLWNTHRYINLLINYFSSFSPHSRIEFMISLKQQYNETLCRCNNENIQSVALMTKQQFERDIRGYLLCVCVCARKTRNVIKSILLFVKMPHNKRANIVRRQNFTSLTERGGKESENNCCVIDVSSI